MSEVLTAGGVAMLVVVDQALWTFRMTVAGKGNKALAAVLGGINAAVYIAALAQVVANLDAPLNMVGYAGGVAVGTAAGVLLEERLGRATAEVKILVTADRGEELARALRGQDWVVTTSPGDGAEGPVLLISSTLDARLVSAFTAAVEREAPEAVWMVEELRKVGTGGEPGTTPPGAPHQPLIRRIAPPRARRGAHRNP